MSRKFRIFKNITDFFIVVNIFVEVLYGLQKLRHITSLESANEMYVLITSNMCLNDV